MAVIDLSVLTIFNPWIDVQPYPDCEIGGGDNLVEVSGYIDKHAELSALYSSGQSLDTYRKALYPNMIPSNVEDSPEWDPTSRMDYDFFDWHADATFVRNQYDEAVRLSNVDLKNAETLSKATVQSPPPDSTKPVEPPQTS